MGAIQPSGRMGQGTGYWRFKKEANTYMIEPISSFDLDLFGHSGKSTFGPGNSHDSLLTENPGSAFSLWLGAQRSAITKLWFIYLLYVSHWLAHNPKDQSCKNQATTLFSNSAELQPSPLHHHRHLCLPAGSYLSIQQTGDRPSIRRLYLSLVWVCYVSFIFIPKYKYDGS